MNHHRRRRILSSAIEPLESRTLMSGSVLAQTMAKPTFKLFHPAGATSDGSSSPSSGAITPSEMRGAYGVNAIQFGSVVGNGQGQTIAIIDAYNDPDAASDLTAFDNYYGISAPPSFTQLNENGQSTPLPSNAPLTGTNGGWAIEESLDIEWAHVMAPDASIILYEANSSSYGDLVSSAVSSAAANSSVTVVSMSFGGGAETSLDSDFLSSHETFLAATGDTGASGSYPASSPNVVAVGGTTLSVSSSGVWQSETAWNDSGGGTSTYETEPAYQKGVQSTGYRTIPDISMDANPGTGVPVYDSWDEGSSSPWLTVGGTSLATPMAAGVMSIVDQGRVINGQSVMGTFSNPSATATNEALPLLYQSATSNFHDITSGSNAGYSAGPGYDEVTGIGSPIANQLVPFMAGDKPTVTSFTASPNPVPPGSNVVLSATVSDPDSTVTGVAFYEESNGTSGLQTGTGGDTYLGAGTLSSGQWTLTTSTTGLSGTVTYYAVPTDASSITGSPATTTVTISTGQFADNGFETPSVGTGNFNDYQLQPTGTGWTFAGYAGVAGNGSGYTQSNPNAPQGTQVAYLQQNNASMSQSVSLPAGTYTISFYAAQRMWDSGQQVVEVLVDGNLISTITPASASYNQYSTNAFTVSAGAHTFEFLSVDPSGQDLTALIDNVQIASVANGQFADAGFESPSVGTGNFNDYAADPTGTAWTFSGYAGVAGNGSGYTQSNPNAPEGTQVAYLQQNNASISQAVSLSAGTYTVSFYAAQRQWDSGQQVIEVLMDGNVVGTITPTTASYNQYSTSAFTVAAGAHTFEFLSQDPSGQDLTALIDDVQIVSVASGQFADSGFEAPSVGTGNFNDYAADPTGTAWTFSGYAGVAGNGSGYTQSNPNAPQGTQVAYLQQANASLSQQVSLASGTYQISFQAAQRMWDAAQQNFELLVDGNVVNTFIPSGTSYATYTSSPFTLSAGVHTFELLSLDTAGGDNTVLIDNIQIGNG